MFLIRLAPRCFALLHRLASRITTTLRLPLSPMRPSNVGTLPSRHAPHAHSLVADTIFVPSGLNCADLTPPLCPSNVCTHSPVATLHTRTVLSPLADTIFVPSGLNCAEFTPPLCPSNVCTHSLSPRSTRAQSCPNSPIRYSCHPG